MMPKALDPGRRLVDGMFWVLLAESLFPLTAVITAGVLTRRLDTAEYGQFILAVTLVGWLQTSLLSLFSRATIVFVHRADDWEAVGSTVVRYQFVTGLLALGVVLLSADFIAEWLAAPGLAFYLRLMAVDIPLFNTALAHRQILIGRGRFRQRALGAAVRWMTRAILVIGLVEVGLGVPGAMLGLVGTSCVDLAVGRCLTRLPLWGRSPLRVRDFAGYAVPLFLFALSQQTFERLDLFMLKALGAGVSEAGLYGAAQNLALWPVWFAQALIALALSSVSQLLTQGDRSGAQKLARQTVRGALLLLAIAGPIAGAAPGLMTAIYGADYAVAAPVLAVLIVASAGQVLVLTTATLLIALGRPAWCLAIGAPLVPLALAGHALTIPRYGAAGASLTSAGVAALTAIFSLAILSKRENVAIPTATFVRCVGLSVVGYALVRWWPAPGAWVLLQLSAMVAALTVALLALGEFHGEGFGLLRLPGFGKVPQDSSPTELT
jgi:O-antigen/teichoic acid export membrane protein